MITDKKKLTCWKLTVAGFGAVIFYCILLSCNNPFQTRTPEKPPPGGVAIKPANSAENVLYNMRVSFDSLSVQDYLDAFSEDFVFVPDPADSQLYENDFRSVWNKEKETDYVTNLFTEIRSDSLGGRSVSIPISNYKFKPGEDMYEYNYVIEIKNAVIDTLRGRAWVYLKEYPDGKWYIYHWVDHRVQVDTQTWGYLRRSYI